MERTWIYFEQLCWRFYFEIFITYMFQQIMTYRHECSKNKDRVSRKFVSVSASAMPYPRHNYSQQYPGWNPQMMMNQEIYASQQTAANTPHQYVPQQSNYTLAAQGMQSANQQPPPPPPPKTANIQNTVNSTHMDQSDHKDHQHNNTNQHRTHNTQHNHKQCSTHHNT